MNDVYTVDVLGPGRVNVNTEVRPGKFYDCNVCYSEQTSEGKECLISFLISCSFF